METINGIRVFGHMDGISEYDINFIQPQPDWIAGYYETGCYDGMGYALVRSPEGKYTLTNLGHCSCYGPFDSFAYEGLTLDDVLQKLDKDLNGDPITDDWNRKELEGLWEAVREVQKHGLLT